MKLFPRISKKRFALRFRKFQRKMKSLLGNPSEVQLDEIQKQTSSLIRKMMCKKDSTLLLAPISGVCYVEWKHYFIRFSDNSATITNGKFSYYVWLPGSTMDDIRQMFYRTVENRRKTMEELYDRKTLENLKSISKDIDNISTGTL